MTQPTGSASTSAATSLRASTRSAGACRAGPDAVCVARPFQQSWVAPICAHLLLERELMQRIQSPVTTALIGLVRVSGACARPAHHTGSQHGGPLRVPGAGARRAAAAGRGAGLRLRVQPAARPEGQPGRARAGHGPQPCRGAPPQRPAAGGRLRAFFLLPSPAIVYCVLCMYLEHNMLICHESEMLLLLRVHCTIAACRWERC